MKYLKLFESFKDESKDSLINNEILKAFLEAALWSTPLPEDFQDMGDNYDSAYGIYDFSKEAILKALDHINKFKILAVDLLDGMIESQVGHDLWLTTQGHGAGFWDRGLGKIGEELTEICKSMTPLQLDIDESGKPTFY